MVTIDQIIADKLNNWTIGEWPIGNFVGCIIALLLATLLCGIIGIERERRGRSAGLRTHLLVGVGSCLIMIVSIYGFPMTAYQRDVARLAAQVITGVGFLGAGAIIHRNSGIKGLTTAATIWVVMAIGMTCGSFNFTLAVIATFVIVVVLTLFRKFETRINKRSPLIVLRADPHHAIVSHLLNTAQQFNCTIAELKSDLLDDGKVEFTFLAVSNTDQFNTAEFVAALEALEGVEGISILNGHKA